VCSTDGRLPVPGHVADHQKVLSVPLADPRCADRRVVGADIQALHALRDIVSVAETVVLTAPMSVWRDRQGERPSEAFAAFDATLTGPAVVRAWRLSVGRPDAPIEPVFHNLSVETVAEAMIELFALAERRKPPGLHRLTFALQRFVRPDASVLAFAAPDDDQVLLKAYLGLMENLGEPLYHDQLVLDVDDLAVRECQVVHKPTATMAAEGGTSTVAVSARERGTPVLEVEDARRLASLAGTAARRMGCPVTLEFVVIGGEPVLVRCQLLPPTS
jgi:hypothetical protein